MTIADVPTSFGLPFFVKTFLPGFVASILYSCAVIPNIPKSFLASLTVILILWTTSATLIGTLTVILILWTISATLIGMIITLFDRYIYYSFEGINWPTPVWDWKYEGITRRFKKFDKELENLEKRKKETRGEKELKEEDKEKLLLYLDYKSLKLRQEVRKYPYNPDKGCYSLRYPEEATIFGNVLKEYENYSEKQYSMHIRFFWSHLWLILPKGVKEDLDLRSANADFPVYLSFVFLTYALFGGGCFYFQENTWFSILTYNIPVGAIICFFLSIGLWFIFYRVSIQAHESYGRYIKALFDLYRFPLAKKLKTGIRIPNLISDNTEKENWRKYGFYLSDYRNISDDAEAWYNRGVALGKLERHDEELEAFDAAIELKPDYAEAWYNKACAYSLKGDKGNALKNLSNATDLDAKYKENAKSDKDLKNLWDDVDFKRIVS